MTRLRRLSPRASDRLLAAVVGAAAVAEAIVAADPGERWPAVLAVAIMAATIAFRRVAPLPGVVALFAAAVPMVRAVDESESFSAPFLMVLIWAYSLGSLPDLRTALRGLVIVWLGVTAVSLSFADPVPGDVFFPCGFAAAAWGAGRAIQHRTRLTAELHEAALRADEDREAQAARAVADERRRIAREMHDVVAHSVSVMVVQAGGARRILERDPQRAVEAAELIERTGRSALLEMRRLLGVFGTRAGEPAATAPQPTLDELTALVARARSAGLPVDVRVEGERRPLPAGAEAAVYRVVQEALTNALKHAGSAPTEVVLRWQDEALEVVVADRGRARAAGAASASLPGAGHGIVGMRERVKVYGGSLSALPEPGGGFVVRARIPLDQAQLQIA
ncbi:MAG TPA: histidine kinase [Solirubrobacteraceae bacterium]|nr:histidine kinase [Solirubrobacteraceae bacterium]